MKCRLLCLLLLCALCVTGVALADDVCEIDCDNAGGELSTTRSYIRLKCELLSENDVSVTIRDGGGSVVYQRVYGSRSGSFTSDEIYLKQGSKPITYQVNLTAGSQTYQIKVKRSLSKVKDAPACSAGYPLAEIIGGNDWRSVTFLNVAALSEESITTDLNAAGGFRIGTVTFSVKNGKLTVTTAADTGVAIRTCEVRLAFSAEELADITARNAKCRTGALNKAIDLDGVSYVAVFLEMTASFDPNLLSAADVTTRKGQKTIWDRMQ